MPTRLRKIRKLRGSRTCGWGQVGQHRKKGMRGGTGKAGLHKHKWSWVVKYAPDHFGKDSLKPSKDSHPKRWLNVNQLDHLYQTIYSERSKKEGERPIIDLTELGYDKLLGGGQVKGAYVIKVRSFTEEARAKVEAAGGEIIQVK
ncbi:MAG: uL15 family ribosomal protein [Nitrososphaerota archaeon]|nr:50S ribosomal protein L15 [Nitrososphaerales archaeon]MDW8044281.1 uL15 family ribosomal protein [Nitrososphaerota archaeon]